jgi:hypothetical protein
VSAGNGSQATSLRLILDFDLGQGDSVAGTVGAESGPAESFSGWVGLTRALELAIEARRRAETTSEEAGK